MAPECYTMHEPRQNVWNATDVLKVMDLNPTIVGLVGFWDICCLDDAGGEAVCFPQRRLEDGIYTSFRWYFSDEFAQTVWNHRGSPGLLFDLVLDSSIAQEQKLKWFKAQILENTVLMSLTAPCADWSASWSESCG